MAVPTGPYDALMLVTYCVRSDADLTEYEDWLRRIDNPFFNASPLAERYVNWKITGGAPVFAPNTYFDLWDMSGADRFDGLRADPTLNAFRAKWHAMWGEGGEGQGGHMQGMLLERAVAVPQTRSTHLLILPAAKEVPVPGWQAWRVTRLFRGPPAAAPVFQTRFAADAAEAAALGRQHPQAVLSIMVAAPD